MIFSILVIVFIGVIAYFHYTQGLFSGTISAISAVLAAVLAFSYHETVVFALLQGRVANYAHAMVLIGLFAVGYLVLRVIFDNLVPGNISLPLYVDRAGAAVMGLIVGIFATGILTIAAATLPFGPDTPYPRYAIETVPEVTVPTGGRDRDATVYGRLKDATPGKFNPDDESGMIVPVDEIVLNMVDRLSTGALAGVQPLNRVHPNYLDQLFGQRLGVQVGASRVAMNLAKQEHATVEGVYVLDQIAQADSEYPSVRTTPLKLDNVRKAPPADALLVVRVRFGRGADDADHHVRFSPASIRLVASGANYIPLGTIDEDGVLRANAPDDYVLTPAESAVDLVFQLPREALGLEPAPLAGRARRDAADAPSVKTDAFIEVKRMAAVDLSGKPVAAYPGPLEQTVVRKSNLPAAKAPGVAGATRAAPTPAAADSPFIFGKVDVSSTLFTPVNVGSHDDGSELTFASGSATLREQKFLRLTVNTTQTIQLLSQGEYTVQEFFVPPGMKMVQLIGTAPKQAPPDPWDWADKLNQFELVDATGAKHKPHGGWARVAGAQGSQRVVAKYDAENPVNDVTPEEGRPTEVWIAFVVPEGTQLTELQFGGKRVAAVDQQVN